MLSLVISWPSQWFCPLLSEWVTFKVPYFAISVKTVWNLSKGRLLYTLVQDSALKVIFFWNLFLNIQMPILQWTVLPVVIKQWKQIPGSIQSGSTKLLNYFFECFDRPEKSCKSLCNDQCSSGRLAVAETLTLAFSRRLCKPISVVSLPKEERKSVLFFRTTLKTLSQAELLTGIRSTPSITADINLIV